MSVMEIVELVVLCALAVGGIIAIIVAIVRGEMKKFIEEKMVEAEKLELAGEKKLAYVLQSVKEKYKILELLMNCRKFIERLIKLTKQINVK